MNEKLLDILKPHGDCIPEEVLLRYVKSSLNDEERRAVEEHLTECEFCSDALDGIMSSGDVVHYRAKVTSARHTVRRKLGLGEERRMFPFTRAMAVAATVLMLALSAWFVQYLIKSETSKIFTDQFEPYPVTAPDTMTDRVVVPGISDGATGLSNQSEIVNEKKKTLKDETVNKESIPQPEPVIASEEAVHSAVIAEDSKTEDIAQSDEVKALSKSASDKESVPVTTEAERPVQDVALKEQSSSKQAKKSAPSAVGQRSETPEAFSAADDHLQRGLALYGEERYAEALAEFELVLKENTSNADANFYSGVSALALEKPDDAIRYLNKTDEKTSTYYEASLWYQSLAYVKKGDKKEASRLLEKVIELKGEYTRQAEETLKEL